MKRRHSKAKISGYKRIIKKAYRGELTAEPNAANGSTDRFTYIMSSGNCR